MTVGAYGFDTVMFMFYPKHTVKFGVGGLWFLDCPVSMHFIVLWCSGKGCCCSVGSVFVF